VLRASSAILAAVAALAIAGCGSERADGGGDGAAAAATPEVKPVGEESAGSVVQFADCEDWNAGSSAERRVTVEKIRGQLTPQSSVDAASPLSDERAYEIFEKACAQDYAASLRLYKLYARAQGFAPLND
jgi:hypothetical protein